MATRTLSLEQFKQKIAREIQEDYELFNAQRKLKLTDFFQKKLNFPPEKAERCATVITQKGSRVSLDAIPEYESDNNEDIYQLTKDIPPPCSFLGIGSPTSLLQKKHSITFKNEQDGRKKCFQNFMDIIFQGFSGKEVLLLPYVKYSEVTTNENNEVTKSFTEFLKEAKQGINAIMLFIGHGSKDGFVFECDEHPFDRDQLVKSMIEAWKKEKLQGQSFPMHLRFIFAECYGHNFKNKNPDPNAEVSALATEKCPVIMTFWDWDKNEDEVKDAMKIELNDKATEIVQEFVGNLEVKSDTKEDLVGKLEDLKLDSVQ